MILGPFFYVQSEHCTSDILACLNSGIALGHNFPVHLYPPFKSIALEAPHPQLVPIELTPAVLPPDDCPTLRRTGSLSGERMEY